ncbi:sugar-binding protein [Paenibacillus luteus]|uniref:sugar-binding protein n=1 Tax=Paenibacillus luteus TaxID=2545753 RepID=UPI0013762FA6|nr:sugar-binding protein [Paenibacillus luteus]
MKVRKRAFIWMMTLTMVFSMLPFLGSVVAADSAPGTTAASSAPSATIYVATNGNDNTGDGSQEKPYKTLAKAKAVVRTLPKTGGDIVVQIADGYYSLDETLVFNKDDSGSASSTIRYEAAPGAKPVISAGEMLEKGVWTEAVGLTQTGGLTAYKTTLKRSDKLRAIYVNDKIANMTLSSQIVSANRTVNGTPTASFTSANNPWAWQNGSNIRAAIVFDANVGLTTATKNPQNIEAESMGGSTARWSRPFVTFASIEQAPAASNKPGGVMLRFQMPYGAISQSLSNNTQYNPGNNQVIRNAFEFFNKRGDFYFDQAESTLYYIPLVGEDINTADVVIPRLEKVLDIRGIPVGDRLKPVEGSDDGRVKNITFNGLKFAHTDYKLYELTGTYTLSDGSGPVTTSSRGFASVQGSIVNTVYFPSSINWHETFYRGYDIPPAAVMINAARNIKVLNGEIGLTGFNGIHVENDVKDIEVTGNYIADTLASGVVIGHPHHIYENDEPIKHESSVLVSGTPIRNWAGVDKEKFKTGTEAVPENIYITNNFLYRNCYGFPGANSLTSFYTTNMQVLHNYFYDSTYGAMSIGWGWDEYDGFGFTTQGTNKTGGPYHGTHETSIARSPVLSTTSRSNKINYNRVEEICTIVNDSGAIYSLGRQGDPGNLPGGGTWDTINTLTNNPVTDKKSNWHSDNWTNFTEMNYNFLDPNPTGKPTTSNNWTNGFHPDEGSTFIKMIGNVVQSKLSHAVGQSRLYEFNNWKRKSDMIAVEGYVDGNNNQNGGPRITYDNFKSEARIWPVKGNEIVLNSGLTNEYTHMIPRSLIADTEFELASNVIVGVGGEKVSRRGLLKAEDTVWLAPANTTVFKEGITMTKAAGNAKSINTPSAAGQYKLYIVYGDGRKTAISKHTAYVDTSESATNVENGKSYEVSAVRPLKLTLSDEYSFTLNGKSVSDGYEIRTAGSWTLVGSTSMPAITINFTTTVSVANKLLPADVSVAPGGTVRFVYDLDDATKKIWISSSSGGHFDGGDDETVASGDVLGMSAPKVPGPYIIYVLAEDGEVLSQSHASVVVSDTTPVNPAVDKTLLTALIEAANNKDVTIYTSHSWNVFATALSEAKTAASNGEIGQAAADHSYYALRNAIKTLQLLPSGVGTAAYGTPVLGGSELDPRWNTTVTLPILKHLTMVNGPTDGFAKVLWDDTNLYVLVRVKDPVLDSSSSSAHEKDSVEIFVDETNSKQTSYGTGMGQYRINYLNEKSFNPDSVSAGVESFAKVVDGGYYIETKIPFKAGVPKVDYVIGFDLQINDAKAAGGRQDIIMWHDATGQSYANGSQWGVITLVKESKLAVSGAAGATSITTKDGTLQMLAGVPVVWSVTAEDGSETNAAIISETGLLSAKKNGVVKVTAIASGSGMSGSALISISGQEGALLSGAETVEGGKNVDIEFSLEHSGTDIKALDITIDYDADKLEFGSMESLQQDFKLVGEMNTDGKLRIIATSIGNTNMTNGLIKLKFKAVATDHSQIASIRVTKLTVANSAGQETDWAGATHTVNINKLDKSGLLLLIAEVQGAHDAAIEGVYPGQYPSGSKATLQAAIERAKVVASTQGISQAEIEEAIMKLHAALQSFIDSRIKAIEGDYNNDNRVSVGDLAIVASAYGKNDQDSNWNEYRKLDLNGDGHIDIVDISILARKILN